MKKIAVFALLAGAAAIGTAAVTVWMKKREERLNCCRYDAGDLEKDDCCGCEVCGEDLDIEPLSEEPDADTAEDEAAAAEDISAAQDEMPELSADAAEDVALEDAAAESASENRYNF